MFAVFAGVYLVPRLLVVGKDEREHYEYYVTARMPQIKEALSLMLAADDQMCIHSGPYSVDTSQYPKVGPFGDAKDDAIFRPKCDRCDDLAAAGLLEKVIVETVDQTGNTEFNARFQLTDFGKTVYTEDTEPGRPKLIRWRFCFGESKLNRIVEARPPIISGADMVVAVRYIAQVDNPHPFLYDPQSQPLHLPVPSRQTPALLPVRLTAVVFPGSGSEIYVDNGFFYAGK